MMLKYAVRLAVAFAAAVLATSVIASLVQTQINLSAIIGLGEAVPPGLRAATSWQDLVRFGPVMAAITAAAFVPAFAAAWFTSRLLPSWRVAIHALAGAAGLWTAFSVMGFFTPMPTLIAAVRSLPGLAAMSATGLAGGLVFAMLGRRWVSRRSAA